MKIADTDLTFDTKKIQNNIFRKYINSLKNVKLLHHPSDIVCLLRDDKVSNKLKIKKNGYFISVSPLIEE